MKIGFIQKHTPSLIAIIAIILCVVPYAMAQELPEKKETQNAEVRSERAEERQQRLSENMQIRITTLTENVIERLAAITVRQTNIIVRLHERTEKLALNGADTTLARERLTEAQENNARAIQQINALGESAQIVRAENPREAFANMRADLLEIREILRNTHQILLDTVAQLKEAARISDTTHSVSDAVSQDNGEAPDAPVTE